MSLLKKSPADDFFASKGVFRRWRYHSTQRLPYLSICISRRDRGIAKAVAKVRRYTAWAASMKLLFAEDAGQTPLMDRVERYHYTDPLTRKTRVLKRENVASCTKMPTVYRVVMQNGRVYYLAGRMGTHEPERYYTDLFAPADYQVLSVCEAEEWRRWLWQRKNPQEYTFNPSELRQRIIDVRALPVEGVIPSRRRQKSGYFTLWGTSQFKILIEQKVVRFALFPSPHTGAELDDIQDGAIIYQAIIDRDRRLYG